MKGADYMQTSKSSREINNAHFAGHVAPSRFSQRIGSTIYRVAMYFPDKETEPLEDKILRLIKNDLKVQTDNATIGLLQASRLPDGGSL
jgi:hypothetical protein